MALETLVELQLGKSMRRQVCLHLSGQKGVEQIKGQEERERVLCYVSNAAKFSCVPLYVGLTIKEDELIDMTALAYGGQWQGVYPSAGGCGT